VSERQIKLYRFADLKEAQVCSSWPQLRRLIDGQGFPPGYLLGPATRVWDAEEIEGWLQGRREASAARAAHQTHVAA
jgi:predicted DNA-binding transcriptional regulator AlpA